MAKSRKKKVASTTELAKHLGLSRWTVSRVINGHPDVKPSTKARIETAMKELRFSPSPYARRLRGGRTLTIGVCFQDVDDPILARKISILQTRLRKRGFRSVIELTNNQAELELDAIRHFIALRMEGIVSVGSSNGESPALDELHETGIPAVLLDPESPTKNLATVTLDRSKAMALVFEHLLALGHCDFGLLGISPSVPYGPTRLEAISRIARKAGLSYRKNFTAFAETHPENYGYAYGRRLAETIIESGTKATALVALDDLIALGAKRRLQEQGFDIPADYSIVGFDNIDISEHTAPRLTTVDQQVDQLMDTTLSLLFQQIDSGKRLSNLHSLVEPRLIVRESTAPSRRGS